ncbi:MAG: translocation/assembly module TamB domain-containing protein [Acidobacteriota bacterium]
MTGRLGDPELTLEASVRELAVGSRELGGGGELNLAWKGQVLRAEASLLGVAALRGGGRLDGRRADVGFQVEAGDLRRLSELVDLGGRRLDGEMVGRLQVSGELASLAARLHVERLGVQLDQRRLDAVGSSQVALSASGFQVDGLRLRDASTASEVALSGVGGWDRSVELRLEASVDLDWLAYALPDLEVTGRLDLDGTLGGTVDAPEVRGTGRLSAGTLDIPGFTERFTRLEGRVLFEGERARIEDVRGAFAGGRASLSGVLDFGGADAEGLDYRFQLAGRDLSFPYLDGWALSGDTDLSMRSTADGHLLAGEARLERLEYLEDVRFDLGTMVRDALRGQRLQVEPAGGLRSAIALEVQVVAPDAVRIRNNLADLRGDADFTLRGSLAQPVIFGEIEMAPGGRLEYSETDYELERGRLTFSDPFRLVPEVDIEASTRVRDIDVKLALSGSIERLEARFSSEPPLPDVEVFRLLAGGDAFLEDDADLVAERTAQLGEDPGTSAATFLYGQAATVLGRRVNDLFRFDRFRIDPLTGADDNLSKARLTVGKRLSKDVFVTYSVDPSSTDNQRIRVEWQVADGLILVLTQNGDDSFSADARWETSF